MADFGRIPSRGNLTIAAIGGLGAVLARPLDAGATRRLGGSAAAGEVLGAGQIIGGPAVQFLGALGTQVVGRAVGNAKVSALGSDLLRAQIMTQTLTAGFKLAVRRTRPDGTQYSLPSGHAGSAFATATVLQRHYGWKAGAPAYGLAAYVAAQRVQARRHHLTDVMLGAALGVVAGRSVTVGRGDARFAVSPTAVPGGGGFNVTWMGNR